MRFFGAYALAFWILASTAAVSETAFTVRADESPLDSVITVDVGAAPFMLEQIGPRQIDLVTPDKTRPFDLSALLATGATRRVAATRVVANDEMNRLRFTLACECAYGFTVSKGILSLTLRAAEPEATIQQTPKAKGVSRYAPSRAPRPFPRPVDTSTVALSEDTEPPVLVSAAEDDVLRARKHLLAQLSRAADQGLLEFVSDEAAASAPETPGVEQVAEIPVQPDVPYVPTPAGQIAASHTIEEADPVGPLRPPAPRESPLRARTAIDKSFRADRADTMIAVAPCMDASDLNLSKWSNSEEFAQTVGEHRRNLLDEFDQPRPDVVRALAQIFLLNGFGVEAETLLSTFGAAVPKRKLLVEFARIVDGRALPADGPIATTAPCHGAALLWRRVAGLPRAAQEPTPATWVEMAGAFADLPQAVREMIAAPLLSSLVESGDVEQAEQLNLILSRAPVADTAALDLAHARLLAAGGEAVAAEGLYQRLAQRDAPEARESLLRLLDSRLSRGAPVSPALAEALSELAFTTRGQPLEMIAKTAEIRARAAIDGPAAALATVRDAIERTPENAAVLKDAGHAALERLSPGEGADAAMSYVEAVMAYKPLVSMQRDGDAARRQVAKELIALGLSNAALDYLAPTNERGTETTRLMKAQALVSLGRIDEGMAELGDADSTAAKEVRATALERAGDYIAAANADPNDQSRALSAGDWKGASDTEAGARAMLAKYMAEPPTEPEEGDAVVSLSGARAAQDAARATRALIEEALSDG